MQAGLRCIKRPVAPPSYNERFAIADRGVAMAAVMPIPAASRVLMSGNEAVARAVWEAGVKVAAAYPGTPSTEMLEVISTYPDLYAEWSVNEKVSLEVAIGAAYAGSRSFCCMKHVGMNVASDALDDADPDRRDRWPGHRDRRRRRPFFVAERAGLALLGALRACAGARAGRFAGSLCDDARMPTSCPRNSRCRSSCA